jgi:hypothetical protein
MENKFLKVIVTEACFAYNVSDTEYSFMNIKKGSTKNVPVVNTTLKWHRKSS